MPVKVSDSSSVDRMELFLFSFSFSFIWKDISTCRENEWDIHTINIRSYFTRNLKEEERKRKRMKTTYAADDRKRENFKGKKNQLHFMRTKCFTNFKFLVEFVEFGIYCVLEPRVLFENSTIESKTSILHPVITHINCIFHTSSLISIFYFPLAAVIESIMLLLLRDQLRLGNVTFYCKLNSFEIYKVWTSPFSLK